MRVIVARSASTPLGSPTTSTSSAAAASTGQPGVDVRLDGPQAQLVHHLHRRRHDPGGDHRADGRRAGVDRREVHQHRADRRRVGRQADAHLGRDAEHALAADEDPAQVVARRLGILAAEHGHVAVREHDLERRARGRWSRPRRGSAARPSCWRRCRRSSTSAGCSDRGRSAGRATATARVRSRLSTPGSTHARRAAGSTDRTRFIFVVAMTTAPSGGTAPPASPVPEPRATNGTPWRAAICTHACTSSVDDREADGDRRALHVRRVVAVQRQLGRAVTHPVGGERLAQLVDERAADRHSVRLGPAHQDHPPRLDRLAVDEQLVAGLEVVAERDEPAVALGDQLALADVRGVAALADGIGDSAPGAADACAAPRGDVRRRQPLRRRRRPCAWRSRHRRHRRRRRRRTTRRAASCAPPQTGARPATCRSPGRRP